MSTWVTNVNTEKTAINSAVTTKVAANSISPTDVGNNMEALCTLLKTLGWDGDTSTFIQTLFKLLLGNTSSINIEINPNVGGGLISVKNGSVKQASLESLVVGGFLYLLDSSGSGFACSVITDTLTGNRTQKLPNKAGTFAMLSDIPAVLNLQATCTLGKETTTGMYIGSGTYASPTDGIRINNAGRIDIFLGGLTVGIFDNSSGGLEIVSADPSGSGFFSNIDTGILTANRVYLLPDEGAGLTIDDTAQNERFCTYRAWNNSLTYRWGVYRFGWWRTNTFGRRPIC